MVENGEELPNKTVEEIQRDMNLGMALLRGDTTQSSIHDAQ
jgi:hypothetical protein